MVSSFFMYAKVSQTRYITKCFSDVLHFPNDENALFPSCCRGKTKRNERKSVSCSQTMEYIKPYISKKRERTVRMPAHTAENCQKSVSVPSISATLPKGVRKHFAMSYPPLFLLFLLIICSFWINGVPFAQIRIIIVGKVVL